MNKKQGLNTRINLVPKQVLIHSDSKNEWTLCKKNRFKRMYQQYDRNDVL